MGYKSIINSAISAQRKATREKELELKRQLRLEERLLKKFEKEKEKLDKIFIALKDEYAKGKIEKVEYEKLKDRENDISIDMVIVGKTPFINLAKRYITGKIEKAEFDEILQTVIPSDFIIEKEQMKQSFNNSIDALKQFYESANLKDNENCQKCTKEKSFFNRLSEIDGIKLCSNCKQELLDIKNFKGFNGKYVYIDPLELSHEHFSDEFIPSDNINSDIL